MVAPDGILMQSQWLQTPKRSLEVAVVVVWFQTYRVDLYSPAKITENSALCLLCISLDDSVCYSVMCLNHLPISVDLRMNSKLLLCQALFCMDAQVVVWIVIDRHCLRVCNMHGRIPNGFAKITGACPANLPHAQAPTPWTCKMHGRLLGGFAICTGTYLMDLQRSRALARLSVPHFGSSSQTMNIGSDLGQA
ncbi:hypothetical protein CDL15_Pgr027122 [Punica granatum]|uniref:Uncharacterized protein n=1 Tax=Punica granatum TaxID=22663 RepID=A0A218X6J8_PUNGR|nr:hypothetical protein CDL15_Pgr027122 [Punica granatum]